MAEQVMGWHEDVWDYSKEPYWCKKTNMPIPRIIVLHDWHPTADIAQAMMCLDKWWDENPGAFWGINAEEITVGIMKDRIPIQINSFEYNTPKGRPSAICKALAEAVRGGSDE